MVRKPTRLRRSHDRLDGLAYALRLRARLDVEQQLIDDAPPAAGHARSNGTKQPNDAWSGSSTTWPDANLALDSGRSWSTVLGQAQPSTVGVELATGRPALRVAYSFGGVLTARAVVTSLHQDCQGPGLVEAR